MSQRRVFFAWGTSIFRKGYDHIRRRPKIFEEASTISEGIGGYEGPFADLQYTLMLSPVSLFSETSDRKQERMVRLAWAGWGGTSPERALGISMGNLSLLSVIGP